MPKPAVIAVNSHVARGSVGGRASVFVLERMGFPVWSVPTVLLPWHPGHRRATRIAPDNAAFGALIADLAGSQWLGEVGAVLSGYFGAVDQVAAVADLVAAVKARSPGATYLCDPILGDDGRLFQPEALIVAIRDRLIPLADIVRANRHELSWLTGWSVHDNAHIVAAARALGAGEVVVTSAHTQEFMAGAVVVTRDAAYLVEHTEMDWVPNGTGDLFSALYLGHRLNGVTPQDAAARAGAAVVAVLLAAARAELDELPLAAGQDAFLADPQRVTVTRVA